MTIWHISLNNLHQRAVRSLLVMLGLAIGIASLVSITLMLTTMQADMEEHLTEIGPNLLVTAGTGEITFSYGGITLPGVIVGARQLTSRDASAISELGGAVKVIVPKLIVRTSTYGRDVLVAGTDIQREFAIKPWLRIVDYLAKFERMKQTTASPGAMGGETLDLTREDPARLGLKDNEVILGTGLVIARISLPLIVESAPPVSWHSQTLAAAVGLALLVGLAASSVPARRAARLDPADALRLL